MGIGDRLSESSRRVEQAVRELLGKLTASQRVSLALIGGAVIIVFGSMIAFSGPSDENSPLLARDEPELRSLLEKEGIPFQAQQGTLRIPAAYSESAQARIFAHQISNQKDPFDWLLQDQGWHETPGRTDRKWLDATRRKVETSLTQIAGIREAAVLPSIQRGSLFVKGRTASTASVQVVSDTQIDDRLALSIRSFVAHAFSIRPDRVSVHCNGIEVVVNDANVALQNSIHDEETRLEAQFAEHLRPLFQRFSVSVSVLKDRTSSVQDSETYDQDRSASIPERKSSTKETSHSSQRAPGVKPNVANSVQPVARLDEVGTTTELETSDNDYRVGLAKTVLRTEMPAGATKKVNVFVTVEIDALRRMIRVEKGLADDAPAPTTEEVRARSSELEALLRSVPAVASPEQVTVRVNAVPYLAAGLALSGEQGSQVMQAVGSHIREIVLAILSLVGCFILYRAATRSVPEMEALPDPVADLQRFLAEKEERDRERARLDAEQSEEQRVEEVLSWETTEEDQEAIELLRAVGDFATERPDIAATVIKNWISEVDQPGSERTDHEEQQ